MPLRDAAVLELFYSSGLRLAELAALDVADVDLYTESVRVLEKAERNAFVRSDCPRWRQSSVIAVLRRYIAVHCLLTKRAAEFPRARFG